ncbi:MAG TPA: hypothetical protein VNT30_09295 [Stellaceae bacterium]|nr:hypothetical protein [Stellaceae bacterium]
MMRMVFHRRGAHDGKCCRDGCHAPADWQVGFKAWARGYPKRDKHLLIGELGVYLCDTHKGEVRKEDFFTEASWSQISTRFDSMRLRPPDLERLEMRFVVFAAGSA